MGLSPNSQSSLETRPETPPRPNCWDYPIQERRSTQYFRPPHREERATTRLVITRPQTTATPPRHRIQRISANKITKIFASKILPHHPRRHHHLHSRFFQTPSHQLFRPCHTSKLLRRNQHPRTTSSYGSGTQRKWLSRIERKRSKIGSEVSSAPQRRPPPSPHHFSGWT